MNAELLQKDELLVKINYMTYADKKKGFFIAICSENNGTETFTVLLNVPEAEEGDTFRVSGEWTRSEKYGFQFKAINAFRRVSSSLYGMEKYLIDNINGIGKTKAKKLVSKFKYDLEDIFNNEPEKIRDFLGLSEPVYEKVLQSWIKNNKEINYAFQLAKLGINNSLALKIYKEFGDNCVQRVNENPYIIIQIKGVGFKTADAVAQKLGIKQDDPRRINAGINFVLDKDTTFGNVCSDYIEFIGNAAKELDVDKNLVEEELETMINTNVIIKEGDFIFTPKMYYAERDAAREIIRLNTPLRYPDITDDVVSEIEREKSIEYNREQIAAIRASLKNRVSVVTGGPGTGKTTVVKGIITAHEKLGHEIICAAPTGRAAKRMNEATGHEAKTLHRLLEWNGMGYGRNESCPIGAITVSNPEFNPEEPEGPENVRRQVTLSEDKFVIIIDEFSMVDILLMSALLKAIGPDTSIVMVGDVDQLPSVGSGTVLADVIYSKLFAVTKLSAVMRQKAGSSIIKLANEVNDGIMPHIRKQNNGDVFAYNLEGREPEDRVKLALDLVKASLRQYDIMNVQVLSAQHRGVLGVDNLNRLIQETLNNNNERIGLFGGEKDIRVGDKVMQIKNNYSLDVYNGDVGRIVAYDDEDNKVRVDYGDKIVEYDENTVDNIVLSYACTVHKSQGSEYPVVIMALTTDQFTMLERNLVYTGITRAKKLFCFLFDYKALGIAVKRSNGSKRNSRFMDRMIDFAKKRSA